MVCSQSLLIPNYLCDSRDRLQPWAVARLFQEVAGLHVSQAGLGFAQLIKQGRAWVLSRTVYDVRRLPAEGEAVELKTWSRGTDGLFAFREFLLLDAAGRAAVASSTYWAVIDFETRRVLRLHDMMSVFDHHPDTATNHGALGHIRLPKDRPAELLGQFSVRPSMLDHTGHVNNAEYVRWIFDFLPAGRLPAEPYSLAIEYLQETHPDDTVSLEAADANAATFVQISNNRTAAVRASLSPLTAQ